MAESQPHALLDITASQLGGLPPAVREVVKSLLNIRQAMYDVLGSYPQENVLPYHYGFINNSALGNQVPANGTVQQSIRIAADAAFIGTHIVGAQSGDYLLQMRMDASDRQLQNIAVHSTALIGTGQRPSILPKPLLLPPNTTISFDVQDLSGAPNNVYFYIKGYKVYNRRINA